MIVLETTEILAAVRRSLETSVLPKLEDDFARVQVAAALRALEEVEHRLREGDPCEASNAAITADARALADELRGSAPSFAQALEQAIAAVPEGGSPRERHRALVEALWALVASEDPNGPKLLARLAARGIESADRDGRWICPESILSLL